jgi:hypothetical protein
MQEVKKSSILGIVWFSLCIALALLCLGLTISVWNVLKASEIQKTVISIAMLNGFTALALTLVVLVKARNISVSNPWRLALRSRPVEPESLNCWYWARSALYGWALQIVIVIIFSLTFFSS